MMQGLAWVIAAAAVVFAGWLAWRLRGARTDVAEALRVRTQLESELEQVRQQQPRIEQLAQRAGVAEICAGTGAVFASGLQRLGTRVDQAYERLDEYRQRVVAYDTAVQHCLQPVEMIFGADKAALDQLIKHVEDARRALFVARAELEKSGGLAQARVLLEESGGELGVLASLAHGLQGVAAPSSASREWLDANTVIEEVIALVAPMAGDRIEIVRALAELPRIHAERAGFARVVLNLLLNALQAMPARGRLAIHTRASGMQGIELDVTDTGEGIAENAMAQIFEPYFTTRASDAHAGMGLPVAHGIIKAHGGAIRVRSVPATGTTFSVSLPLQRRQHTAEDATDA